MSLSHFLNDDNEDEILAQVQEESLRHYREVEVPRLNSDRAESKIEIGAEDDFNTVDQGCSSKADSNASILCTQVGGKTGTLLFDGEEAQGFHLASGSTYIYPTNFPIRQYQAAIVRSALFKNTLVGLPTGLGKTFIAAVVMYNFYRWFPLGKVVFMAPTRPLVAQQIKACYGVMGIPPDHTTEMTGVLSSDVRKSLWNEKRVFFLTPQVMMNDLRSNICPALSVKCVVIDEAHKATKDYAYCHVVKLLHSANGVYRTLALSATPGNDINAVIQVIRNLNISCLEMRGEDSIDVMPYTHGKSVEHVVVDLSGELLRIKEDFMKIYERFARNLIDNRALTNNIAFLSKFQILKAMEKFRSNPPRGMSTTVFGSLVSDFTMCMTFAHALELLQIYGLRAFYRYLADESGEKSKAATTRLLNNEDVQRLLKTLHASLYPKPGSNEPYVWGHPKLKKLVFSLTEHFENAAKNEENTKAIVFCQYKVVVNEIVELLGRNSTHIRASVFVGQSGGKEKGMPQAKQLQIMKDFRDGTINCLVATCVAEEGLDIGEVDLIILMESQKSPVRLVQRLGRTGRKRRGRCIVLLTRGKEESKFHEAMASRKAYVRNIIESKAVKNSLIQYSPPMFPPGIKPQQQLVHIKVIPVDKPCQTINKNKQGDIRQHVVLEEKPFLDKASCQKLMEELGGRSLKFDTLPARIELWHRKAEPLMSVDELLNGDVNKLAEWNDWNNELAPNYIISSTTNSKLCCELVSFDSRKEDVEHLQLIDKGSSNQGPSSSSTDMKIDDLELAPVNKNPKKSKKKVAPDKNYGMDIRSCMAAAEGKRAAKKIKMDAIQDEVVIDCDNDLVSNGVDEGHIRLMKEKDRIFHVSDVQGLDIAGIFGMENEELDNLIYGGGLLSGLEEDVGMCVRLGKCFRGFERSAPKPKLMDVGVFQLQCDRILELMENGIDPIVFPKYGDKNISKDEINDNFVSIDDLFSDDEMFEDKNQNPIHSKSADNAVGVHVKPCRTNENDNMSLASTPGSSALHQFPSSPIVESTKPPVTNIYSSTPLNPFAKRKSAIIDKSGGKEDLHWSLDDILVEDEELPIIEKKAANNDSISTMNKAITSELPVTNTMEEENVWCLDDIFDEDSNEETLKNDTSCYGITQMVSQIERDKIKNRAVVSMVKSMDHEVILKAGNEKSVNIPSLKVGNEKSVNIPSLTTKCDEVIYVIDSDSCSNEGPVESKTLNVSSKIELNQNVPPNLQVKDNNRSSIEGNQSLLDEDEDIFSLLDGHNLKGTAVMNENQPCSSGNVKKFKKTGVVLSKLNLDEDNDRQDEMDKFVRVADLSADLKVGPVSKRKLSFDGFLNNLDETVRSKYFQNEESAVKPKRSFKMVHNYSVNGKNNEEEDDTFIHPVVQNRIVGSAENNRKTNHSESNYFSSGSSSKRESKRAPKKKSSKKGNVFIEREAEESGIISSDDSDNSSLDGVDDSFVNDDCDEEQSYVHYLKSVKSPVIAGKFKIPVNRHYRQDVLSQTVVSMDNGYENDSFCVDSEEEISVDDMTVLELAEKRLSKKRRKNSVEKPTSEEKATESSSGVKRWKRRIESDSDGTPERPIIKRNRVQISPELETAKKSQHRSNVGEATTSGTLPPEVITVDSDTDEDMREAIRLSTLESNVRVSAEMKFEEELKEALILSQREEKDEIKRVTPSASSEGYRIHPLLDEPGTSFLFMSQPIFLNRKPMLSTKLKATTTKRKSADTKQLFDLDDSD